MDKLRASTLSPRRMILGEIEKKIKRKTEREKVSARERVRE